MKALETALYSKLSTDATLLALVPRIYTPAAPRSASYPFLTFAKIAGAPAYTWTQEIETVFLYQIAAHAKDMAKDTIQDAMARVDALLINQALTVTGKSVWVVRKDGDLPDAMEEDGGAVYLSVGATYRLEVAPV